MRLANDEIIRRFMIHVLPDGLAPHPDYGLLGGATRKADMAKICSLLGKALPDAATDTAAKPIPLTLRELCPCCGGPMRIIEIFRLGQNPQSQAPPQRMAA